MRLLHYRNINLRAYSHQASALTHTFTLGRNANNTNLTFLYKIEIDGFLKVSAKIKLFPVGIELTTDHHWFTSVIFWEGIPPSIA